ncbi:MAG: tetratricopeptide repeat protein [Bacteroidota bacterium]
MNELKGLKADLKTAETSQAKINILRKIAWETRTHSPNEALTYGEKALELAQASGSRQQRADVFNTLGVIHKNMGHYPLAKKYFQQSLDLRLEAPSEELPISIAYSNLGIVYTLEGDYEQAVSLFLQSLQLVERLQSFDRMGNCNTNLGVLWEKQGDLSRAQQYHEKALQCYEKEEDPRGIAYALNNKANIETRIGNYQNALDYYHRSIVIKQEINDSYGVAHSYSKVGMIHKELFQDTLALEYLYHAMDIQEMIEDKRGLTETLLSIGSVYYQQQKPQGAIAFASKSLELAKSINAKGAVHQALKGLAEAHQLGGNYQKAYEYYVKHVQVKEELFNDEKLKAIALIQSKFETKKKDQQIEQLSQQQEILKSVNKELELFAGKASHDLKSPLRNISSFSNLLERRFGKVLNDEGLEFLGYIQQSAKDMEQLLTDLLKYAKTGLNPDSLQRVDLNQVIARVKANLYIETRESESEIASVDLPQVCATQTLMIQLFQNLISNAIKFRRPDQKPIIQIGSKMQQQETVFFVADNGIGIPPEKRQYVFEIFARVHDKQSYEGTGIGLATVKKILDQLNGRIWVESNAQGGTTFCFVIPSSGHQGCA